MNAARIASPSAPDGNHCANEPKRAVRRARQHHGPAGEQQQVDEVGGGQRRLGAQRTRQQQPERDERRRARAATPARTRPPRPPPPTVTTPAPAPTSGQHQDLEHLDDQQREHLGGEQPGAAAAASRPSRFSTPYRRSKPVAIATDVNDVDMMASASTPGVSASTGRCARSMPTCIGADHAADQHQDRDDDGEHQLFAVAQQQPYLHRRLRAHLPGQRCGARSGGEVESS